MCKKELRTCIGCGIKPPADKYWLCQGCYALSLQESPRQRELFNSLDWISADE